MFTKLILRLDSTSNAKKLIDKLVVLRENKRKVETSLCEQEGKSQTFLMAIVEAEKNKNFRCNPDWDSRCRIISS